MESVFVFSLLCGSRCRIDLRKRASVALEEGSVAHLVGIKVFSCSQFECHVLPGERVGPLER